MNMKKNETRSTTLKKPSGGKKSSGQRANGDPPIIRLHLEGRVKRADIRRAVRAVLHEKSAANGDI